MFKSFCFTVSLLLTSFFAGLLPAESAWAEAAKKSILVTGTSTGIGSGSGVSSGVGSVGAGSVTIGSVGAGSVGAGSVGAGSVTIGSVTIGSGVGSGEFPLSVIVYSI